MSVRGADSVAGEMRRAKLWSVQDSSGECEFVSFVSLYNPSASEKVCNERIQAEGQEAHTASGGPETNSPNSQTHTACDSVRALLEDPPDWLAKQLARCKADPGRWLKPTAAALAHTAHGPGGDASAAEPELRGWLEGIRA